MSQDSKQLLPRDFPPLLREISDPPEKLFMKGSLPSFDFKWLTIVGSRKYTPYGKQVCEHLIKGLSGSNVVIVSGLALGIDAIAHAAALENNLVTIAVPGSGLDERVLYPRSNHSLSRAILDAGGALVSEFEPMFKATPWSFPQRNRIMAGISHATLLIEATERSGTLITARLTTEYNRELFVVPNSIFNESSRGTHQFLKLGATPITSSDDIIHALGLERNEERDRFLNQNVSSEEKLVLDNLNSPMSRDKLIRALKMEASNANMLLSKMELSGLITEDMGVVRTL